MSRYFAICPLGLEEPLGKELQAAGCVRIAATRAGVRFEASKAAAMRACMTTRLASRILLYLDSSDYYDAEDIYNFACRTKWERYFGPEKTIRVDVNARRANLESLDFALLRIKDGICDRFQHFMERRPDVDRQHPQVRVFAFIDERDCHFYIDLCGEALFKRGWRQDKGEAPLKENLAAALLTIAGWKPETPLMDIFCGSGTIAIEAALIAQSKAPGLSRHYLFENLSDFEKDLYEDIVDDLRAAANPYVKVRIHASDISTHVVEKARENARLAGLEGFLEDGRLTFDALDARAAKPIAPEGLLVSNPPYGEQSNPKSASVASMMKDVADNLKHSFAGWDAWLLTSDRLLPRQMRLKESRKVPLFNGPLECRFFEFKLVSGSNR